MLSKRELLGFTLAPLPVAAPILLTFAMILSSVPPDSEAALQAAAGLVLASYAAALLIGLPVHLILRWKQQTSLVAYLGFTFTGAGLTGASVLICCSLFSCGAEDNPFSFRTWSAAGATATLMFAALACLCAFVFWAVAIKPARI